MSARVWQWMAACVIGGVWNVAPAMAVSPAQYLAQGGDFELEDFEFWAQQCVLLSTENDYQKTQETCEQAIGLKPKRDNLDLWFARGQALFHLGNYSEAMTSFSWVLERAPNDSISLTYQCAAQFLLSRPQTAVDTCEQALEQDGNWGTDSPALAWYYRGLALQTQGRLETALGSYQRAQRLTPDDQRVQAGLCTVAFELGLKDRCSLAEAVVAYERAIAANPDDITLWFQQGLVLEQLGRYQQAITAYEGAIAIKPDYSLALARHCTLLNENEAYEAALAACDAALAGDGNWDQLGPVVAWSQRSRAQLGLEDYEAALGSAERAIVVNPQYSGGWINRAVGLWHLGDLSGARLAIQEANRIEAEIEPLLEESFNRQYPEPAVLFQRRRAVTAYNEGAIYLSLAVEQPGPTYPRQARDAYQRAINIYQRWQPRLMIDPLNLAAANNIALPAEGALLKQKFLAELWTSLAVAELYSGRLLQASDAAHQAVRYDEESYEVWYNLGVVNLNSPVDPVETWDAFAEAATLNPESLAPVLGQAMTLLKAGCNAEALRAFEQVLNIDPAHELAQEQHRQLLALSSSPLPASTPCPIELQ